MPLEFIGWFVWIYDPCKVYIGTPRLFVLLHFASGNRMKLHMRSSGC